MCSCPRKLLEVPSTRPKALRGAEKHNSFPTDTSNDLNHPDGKLLNSDHNNSKKDFSFSHSMNSGSDSSIENNDGEEHLSCEISKQIDIDRTVKTDSNAVSPVVLVSWKQFSIPIQADEKNIDNQTEEEYQKEEQIKSNSDVDREEDSSRLNEILLSVSDRVELQKRNQQAVIDARVNKNTISGASVKK